MAQRWLLSDLDVATLSGDASDYGLIREAAIGIVGSKIGWVGPASDVPESWAGSDCVSLGGRLVTPALIDCHTHIVHGGNRAREFELRLTGASYEQIARAGGGIVSTVAATREASETELLEQALHRVDALIAEGVALVEIKSGYGLDQETELRMLRVARQLGKCRPIRVRTSFLGAHAVPTGMQADTYIDEVCLPALKAAHAEGLVDAVDGFCENIAFSRAQIQRVFETAAALDLPVKLHAEQLSHQGATLLAAQHGALSADHVEYATDSDAQALAKAGSVAVLLPGAYYTLKQTQAPPVSAFRNANVPMAVATDWNPGSSPLGSLLLAMNMSCTLFSLSPAEALAGVTRYAAQALGLEDCGVIAPGFRADLAVWNVSEPAELAYRIGGNPLQQRIFGGML